jgi:hypothetical protein
MKIITCTYNLGSLIITESLFENATLDWFKNLSYAILEGPDIATDEPAAFYLGPLPKVISYEIMINNLKNPSEIKK